MHNKVQSDQYAKKCSHFLASLKLVREEAIA